MGNNSVEEFAGFLKKDLQQEPIIERVEAMAREGKPSKMREVVFNSRFLAPAFLRFFGGVRQSLGLSEKQIRDGLSFEGFSNSPEFGASPARKAKHLFTKSDVIKSVPPESWFQAKNKNLTECHACPDFAIRQPLLPLSIVGEVKYLTSRSAETAVRDLFNASRQAVFYLGAFNGGGANPVKYESAMIILADASRNGALSRGQELMNQKLLDRYGSETGIYFVPITLL